MIIVNNRMDDATARKGVRFGLSTVVSTQNCSKCDDRSIACLFFRLFHGCHMKNNNLVNQNRFT
jgi:hypothetical protein